MVKVFHTLTFRLTLWYALIFAISSVAILAFVYFMLAKSTEQRIDQLLLSEVKEFKELYQAQGVEKIGSEFSREAEIDGTDRIFFRLLSSDGKELAASDLHAWQGIVINRSSMAHITKEHVAFDSIPLSGRPAEARIVYAKAGENAILQIGYMPRDEEKFLGVYRQVASLATLMGLVLAATIGWFMARRALEGVEQVRQTAISIGEGDLSRRVIVRKTGDEIDHLADTFNAMLDRIHALVTELKEVTDNIAHDLRSPITRIRGIAETALTGKETLETYREMAGIVIEESDRLVGIINTMLQISEVDTGLVRLTRNRVNLVQLVQDAYELFRPVAEDQGITLRVSLPSQSVIILGDSGKLQRVMANLIDNAVNYTPRGGTICLSAKENVSHAILTIEDSGMGIGEEDLPHIFERFYRGDRSRTTPGSGLGLSLVGAFVRAHGGEISVTSSLEQGTTVTILLPRPS